MGLVRRDTHAAIRGVELIEIAYTRDLDLPSEIDYGSVDLAADPWRSCRAYVRMVERPDVWVEVDRTTGPTPRPGAHRDAGITVPVSPAERAAVVAAADAAGMTIAAYCRAAIVPGGER